MMRMYMNIMNVPMTRPDETWIYCWQSWIFNQKGWSPPPIFGCPSTHTKLTLPTPSTPHFWSFWTHFRDPLWHNQVSWEAWYTRKTRAGSWLQSGFRVLAPVAPDGSRFITFHHRYPSHPHIMNQNVSECITSIRSPVSHVLWFQILCGQDAG